MKLIGKYILTAVMVLNIMVNSPLAKPRIPGLLQIPTADVLPHGLFNVSFRSNMFSVIDKDSVDEFKYPIGAGVLLGLSNRAQVGVQYGNEVSISFKAYAYEASGKDFFPDVVVGARSLFGSQEAWLHGVEDLDSIRGLRNEAYIALSLNIGENTRVHLGASSTPGANNQFAEGFGGIEQFFGSGVYLGYEAYQRFGSLHHNLNFIYKYKSFFSFTVGLTEFHSWINQDGEWGFFPSSSEPQFMGYDVPGINVGFSLGGWAMKSNRKTNQERFKKLTDDQLKMQNELLAMKRQMEEIKKEQAESKQSKSPGYARESSHLVDFLDLIKNKINSDVPYDPKEVEDLRKKILNMGRQARTILSKIVTNPTTDTDHRIQACIIMGLSDESAYTEPLLKATADPEPAVRREAILALGKMKLQVALEFAETLLDDVDENVIMAAKAAIRMIKEASGEKLEEKEKPEAP